MKGKLRFQEHTNLKKQLQQNQIKQTKANKQIKKPTSFFLEEKSKNHIQSGKNANQHEQEIGKKNSEQKLIKKKKEKEKENRTKANHNLDVEVSL